ncbi:hypothetical protein CR105_14000 [Massilia eurypsychrophila]|uniref:Uncharacterized protein n=1 Tax=Massilia eurypsychrophila TaxID=1485217 RepID=A0A2G8TEU2_9BURK|nr:hypothetical protein [Massilia eurypsychrophila]PIL44557.1 hypothetical protein CR105_14000 [Massilia eurypsychrophila]
MQNDQAPASAPAADPGFKLPGPAGDALPKQGGTPIEVAPAPAPVATDTSTRDLAIGGAVFLILLVIYFFVRNAYVHHLVVRRVAPSTAGSAGWLMFVGLCFLSAAAVLAMINASKFLTFAVTGPLVAVGLIALVATLFVGRR